MERSFPWLKWWIGTVEDLKLRRMAEQCKTSVAAVIGVWAYLLETAAKGEPRGVIDWESLEMGQVAYDLLLPVETIETVCNDMKRSNLVTETGEIVAWDFRQAKRENQEPPGASTKRVQKLRARQKAMKNNDLPPDDDETGGNDMKRQGTTGNDPKKKIENKSKPKPPSSSGDDGFGEFWEAYPRKQGKIAARKAWAKLKVQPELLTTILEAIAAQKEGWDWTRDGGQCIPHPATWLNGGRWLDEVRTAPPTARPGGQRWWESKDAMLAFALTLDPPLTPNKGEYAPEFKARIEAALERAGRGQHEPERRAPTEYTPPEPAGGVDNLTPEQRKARMAEMKQALKMAPKPAEATE